MVEVPLRPTQTTDITPVTVERTGAHSHIRGLGIDESLNARKQSEGLVGQTRARRALGVTCRMIMKGQIAGRGILIAGEPGTGKTAIAHALSQSLGAGTPFTAITGSEVFSLEMSKTEALTQALRRSIGVKIHEVAEVCEGEVVSIEVNAPTGESASRTGTITLKTTDMESVFDLGPRMIEQMTRLQVVEGDVISIDTATGNMTKLGKSFSHAEDYDASGPQMKYVNTPEGELKTRRETVHTLTLHEIDVVNSRNQGFLALFSGDTGEIKQEVREHVNQQVAQWQDEKKADLIPGVLFIDEVHMLDIECFSFLNRAIESPNAPIMIVASNRGMARIRGTNEMSPHGIPFDLLQRLTIVHTDRYSPDELRAILRMRCEEEDVTLTDEAMDKLVTSASTYSLRYAMQLITVSSVISARRSKDDEVDVDSVEKAMMLFIDRGRSAEYLDKQNASNLYITDAKSDDDDDDDDDEE